MQHERLATLAFERIDDLRIAGGAERGGDQRLGLAAREQRRTVGTRQHADLDRDRAHGLEVAAVDARLAVEDALAHDAALELEQFFADLIGGELRRITGAERRRGLSS